MFTCNSKVENSLGNKQAVVAFQKWRDKITTVNCKAKGNLCSSPV